MHTICKLGDVNVEDLQKCFDLRCPAGPGGLVSPDTYEVNAMVNIKCSTFFSVEQHRFLKTRKDTAKEPFKHDLLFAMWHH